MWGIIETSQGKTKSAFIFYFFGNGKFLVTVNKLIWGFCFHHNDLVINTLLINGL